MTCVHTPHHHHQRKKKGNEGVYILSCCVRYRGCAGCTSNVSADICGSLLFSLSLTLFLMGETRRVYLLFTGVMCLRARVFPVLLLLVFLLFESVLIGVAQSKGG
jgi:hypothetical protein